MLKKFFKKNKKEKFFPTFASLALHCFSFWEDVVNKTWKLSFPQWAKNSAINIGFSMCSNANVFKNKYLHSTKDIFGDAPFEKYK